MSKFGPAQLDIYIDWLRTHLGADVKPTHWYDYPYPTRDFLFANTDFTTGGECGANARSILIPPGIKHLGGAIGHNNLFFFGEGDAPDWIPIYSNPEFLVLPGILGFIEEKKERQRAFRAEQEKFLADSKEAMRESDLGKHVLRDAT